MRNASQTKTTATVFVLQNTALIMCNGGSILLECFISMFKRKSVQTFYNLYFYNTIVFIIVLHLLQIIYIYENVRDYWVPTRMVLCLHTWLLCLSIGTLLMSKRRTIYTQKIHTGTQEMKKCLCYEALRAPDK